MEKTIVCNEDIRLKGRLRITKADPTKAVREHAELERLIREKADDALIQAAVSAYHAKARTEAVEYHNVVVTVGRAYIANALWSSTPEIRVTHVELGTGTNAPAAGDTALQTATYRNALASGNNVSNVVRLTGYYNLTETSGTFREAGLFMNGTGTLGTGTLLSRVAINITKTTSDTMTIEWEITLS